MLYQSCSTRDALQGLHFQKNHTQGALVRVTLGEVYDVAVECCPGSATYGKWVGVILSADTTKRCSTSPGASPLGFLMLSNVAGLCYKCTDVYAPQSEEAFPTTTPS